MKYKLTDYSPCLDDDDKPNIYIFKNKDELINQLLSWANAEAEVTLEVKK